MPIEKTESGTMITGPEVGLYDALSFRTYLKLEITTGLKLRNGFSLVNAAIKRGYVRPGTRSKRRAYADIDAYIVGTWGGHSLPLES